jgi:hypothetical protein
MAVGYYVSRNTFISMKGEDKPGWPNDSCYPVKPGAGDLALNSSKGPTRDGRLKPDFVAPGHIIVTSLNTMNPLDSTWVFEDGIHATASATSAAAPAAAGAVALILQMCPYLDAPTIDSLLASMARVDSQTGAVPNNSWGNGKVFLDHIEVKKLEAESPARIKNRFLDILAYPNPFSTRVSIKCPAGNWELGVGSLNIYDIKGKLVHSQLVTPNSQLGWDGHDNRQRKLANGIYVIRLRYNDNLSLEKSVVLIR